MSEQTFFFIASNGRTGSTWLETSLGRLPDVAVDWETKWHPVYGPGHAHRVIPDGQGTCRGMLREISETSPVVGSKLTFDRYRDFPFEEIPDLLEAIEPDISIIHLTRGYFDILLSFEARGGVNVIRDPSEMEELAGLFGKDHAILAELFGATVRRRGRNDTTKVTDDLATIFSKMFTFLLNDLLCIELSRRAIRSLHVEYSDINARFREIATFVGSRCDAETAAHVAANPVTEKLEKLPPTLIKNWEQVKEMAAIFDEAVSDYIRERRPIFNVWQATQINHFKGFGQLARMIQ